MIGRRPGRFHDSRLGRIIPRGAWSSGKRVGFSQETAFRGRMESRAGSAGRRATTGDEKDIRRGDEKAEIRGAKECPKDGAEAADDAR